MAERFVLAIDQGTSSTKCLLLAEDGLVAARSGVPLAVSYPHPGWVEQSPDELWAGTREAVAACVGDRDPASVVAVGISNQRESLVLWDRRTGEPAGPLVGWQDQRTAGDCNAMIAAGLGELVRHRSGLPLDPMFSALKARWLLDHYDGGPGGRSSGRWVLGTVDAFLLSRLSGPGDAQPRIESGNASRTQLMDIEKVCWDPVLLDLFGIAEEVLPRIVSSVGPFGEVQGVPGLADGTPVTAVLGDSHAALFAHGIRRTGVLKATYGTGSSVVGLVPPAAVPPAATAATPDGRPAPDRRPDSRLDPGLGLTVVWDIDGPVWAAEGNIRSTGATLSWLATVVGSTPAALADLARTVGDPGIDLVPAFTGLGSPWWNRSATATISGLGFETGLADLARAALDSTAFQIADVVATAARSGLEIAEVLADGGASANDDLMQFQADLLGIPVSRAAAADSSALGAAHLAGLAAGLWCENDLRTPGARTTFEPRMPADRRAERLERWATAVQSTLARP